MSEGLKKTLGRTKRYLRNLDLSGEKEYLMRSMHLYIIFTMF